MSDLAPDRLPADFEDFDEEELLEELPADFASFDDNAPAELPAGFAGFDEIRPPAPSVTEELSPPTADSAPRAGSGSQLLAPLNEDERNLVMSFAQTLGATVTHVVPRGAPDPVFPRDAAHDWDTWQRQRDDRMFAEDREARGRKSLYEQMQEVAQKEKYERQRRKDWLDRQHKIQRGWAKWMRWRLNAPAEAEQYRREHEDGQVCWLLDLATRSSPLSNTQQKDQRHRR
jgi:hypothetical protein